MKRSPVLWTLVILLTLISAVWQRVSGPSYPVRFKHELAGVQVSGKLARTHGITGDLPVRIRLPEDAADAQGIEGMVHWRRYPTQDDWEELPLVFSDGALQTALPKQGMAGKVEYWVELHKDGQEFRVPRQEAVLARFKGDVPLPVLLIHILFMFFGMAWSTRAGLAAVVRGPDLQKHARIALGLLLVGGFVLGPIVQKYAFDAYWTGWPLGEDLTDNKLAAAVLMWALAVWFTRQGGAVRRAGRAWAIAAMLVVFIIFSIPHSLHGSTLDYETGEQIQTAALTLAPTASGWVTTLSTYIR